MYKNFGKTDGLCKDCTNFRMANGGWSKCLIYGTSSSEATDWNGRYQACGLKDKESPWDIPVVKTVTWGKGRKLDVPMEGQTSLFDRKEIK